MSELRQREVGKQQGSEGKGDSQEKVPATDEKKDVEPTTSEDATDGKDGIPLPDIKEPPIPAQKVHVPFFLRGLPPRWQNWVIRGFMSLVLLLGFLFLLYLGPVALVFVVLLIEVMCFREIINIGYAVYRSQDLPWFRTLSWYFLLCANYFVYGRSLKDYFGIVLKRELEFLWPFIEYYKFISFWLYTLGFIMFVITLRKSHYLVQFTLFGWTHVALLIVVSQSNIICHSIFEGLIWFLISTSCVICNDIMAYMFGFFFGRTSLIKLSPKKTWEGFIGALFSTVIYGVLLAKYLAPYKMFTCPAEYDEESMSFVLDCEPSSTFQVHEYMIPESIQQILSLVGIHWQSVEILPIQIHAFVFALFASVIAPFSGFFASGFKRAYKIKDFGDVFPGHGGIMDRFDCQLMMASFHYVYMATFIRSPNPQKILQQVFQLPEESQLQIYHELQKSLTQGGYLPGEP